MGLVLSLSLSLMITRESCTKRRKGIYIEQLNQSDIQPPPIKCEKSFDYLPEII